MAIDLATFAAPKTTAILCMEMQRGVVGDLSPIPALVESLVKVGLVPSVAALLAAGRRAGVPVVFCTYERRADGRGTFINTPMAVRSSRVGGNHMVAGSPSAEVVPELGRAEIDLACPRAHGMSPFTGTSLDALLRSLGVTTVVAAGVSLNVGIMGMAIEAVGLGYRVVVPRDCVAGTPIEYGEAVLANALPVISTVTTGAALAEAWSRPS